MSKVMKFGITGSIGSGKTTVSEYIRSKGYYVFDCDKYNHLLLQRDNIGYKYILSKYPEVIINDEINKQLLSNLIFNNPAIKKDIEDYLHPLIVNEMDKLSHVYNPYFAEVPLLFESNLENHFDATILVVTNKETSLKRLEERGLSYNEALIRYNNQLSPEVKMKRADKIIYNNGILEELYCNVDTMLKELKVC